MKFLSAKPLLFFVVTVFLFATVSFAQSRIADSLLQLIAKCPNDSSKIILYRNLCHPTSGLPPEKVIFYLKEANQMAIKNKLITGEILIKNDIGNFYTGTGDYDTARVYLKQALSLAEKSKSLSMQAFILSGLGVSYERQGNYKSALEFYLSSQKIREHLLVKDPRSVKTITGLAQLYNNIGVIMHYLKNDKEALEYYDKAVEIFADKGELPSIMAATYSNYGNLYADEGKQELALSYFKKAEDVLLKFEDPASLAVIEVNLGGIYELMNKNEEAIRYYKKGLELARMVNDRNIISFTVSTMANLCARAGQKENALKYNEEAMQLAVEIKSRARMMDVYQSYYFIYKTFGESAKALEYHEKFTSLRDSLSGAESHKQLDELRARYDSDRRESLLKLQKEELRLNELEAKNQSNQKLLLMLALAAMIIISYFIFSNYRKQKRVSALIATQKKMVDEKQKEIIDSITYAQRIQKALIPSDYRIEKELKKSK